MNYVEIEKKISQQLTAKRTEHSKGVSRTAALLAERFGADVKKAKLAGILHDCMREISKSRLLELASEKNILVDEIILLEPVLLHAPLGAKEAANSYGITDADICRAISVHTLGGREMTTLDKIIYLADCIEPTRSFPGVDRLRGLAEHDLNEAVLAAYDQSIEFIIHRRGLIHPQTIDGRNHLLLEISYR